MMTWLIKKFIQNSENVSNPTVKKAYAALSSIVGIINQCNLIIKIVGSELEKANNNYRTIIKGIIRRERFSLHR